MSKWKSIIQKDPSCSYLSGAYGVLHKHHCIHGTANRKKAEEDGLYVMLTMEEHRNLHDRGDYDEELKKIAQQAWMEKNGTADDFRKRYGRSYL